MNPNWDDRYRDKEFAYGKIPNQFFKEWLLDFEPGKILMPADGEGRNGVHAAKGGWNVTSFDLSVEGKQKALRLAEDEGVSLHYEVGDFEDLRFETESFDAIGLIYAHFPTDKKLEYHRKLIEYLSPGGVIIFEAFSKSHLELSKKDPKVGGPKDKGQLFSTEELTNSFDNFEILYLKEELCQLSEGRYHNGLSSVIRFVGRKPTQMETF